MPKINMDQKKFLICVFCLSLIIKIFFFIIFLRHNPCILMFDPGRYHNIALQLISGNGFVQPDGLPQFYRLPGYPTFLAACYKVFGVHPVAALWIQMLLGSIIPILIFILTLVLFPGQVLIAKTASIISCFDLGYIIFSELLLSDALFTIFFTVFLILFLKNYRLFFCKNKEQIQAESAKILLSGLSLGIACLIRPVGHALFLTCLFMLFVSNKRVKEKFKEIALFSLGVTCTLGLWLIRNFLLTGYIFMHTLSGPHFLNHAAVRICMAQEKTTYTQAQDKVYAEIKEIEKSKQAELNRPLQEIETCIIAEELTAQYILNSPGEASKLFVTNMLKTTFGLYSSELIFVDSGGQLPPYSNDRGLKSILIRFLKPQVNNKLIIPVIYFEILLFLILLLGLGFFIFSAIFNHEKLCTLAKLLPIAGCIIFITIACGYARLRLPIESFLIILASKALIDFLGRD